MKYISFKKILILMLMLFVLIIGFIEFSAQREANKNSEELKMQENKFAQTLNSLDELNAKADNLQSDKENIIRELYPIQIALNHGFSEDVGITIIREAKKYDLRPSFIMGLIETESTWRNHSPNGATATGLMQVTTNTGNNLAKDLGISNPDLMDPVTNIKVGTYCIANLIRIYGDVHTALTAYNQGEGGMKQYVAYYGTSRSGYSRKVISFQEHYEQ